MKKLGLFFGAFNPVHNGHLMMANYIVNNTNIDSVSLVVSPEVPFKEHKYLASFKERITMIKLATLYSSRKIHESDVEYALPEPHYTYNTLKEYERFAGKYYEITLIIGSDNLLGISDWKNAKEIIENYEIYVCPRNGIDCNSEIEKLKTKFNVKGIKVVDGIPECSISSTFVREQVGSGKSILFYVPSEVEEYIIKHKLYGCGLWHPNILN